MNIFIYNLGKVLFAVLFKICCAFDTRGRENIPREGGFIIASNHRSNLDPIIAGVGCGRIINFMAKEDLFKNRFFAWILLKVGAFPIKRNTGDIGAIKEAIKRLKAGFGLVIFPQGTRKQRTQIDVQPGIGLLAARAKVAVIPTFISGSAEALPIGAKMIRFRKIRIIYGKPLYFKEKQHYPEIAHEVMRAINSLGSNTVS
ncbi:MAG: lysophospholipid acyltransferase family protein [Candidatus Omnitrophota bacterium]|nr:lysophospholipid acyltransferase family protein [Candidatus Omnitrophota bacterium]